MNVCVGTHINISIKKKEKKKEEENIDHHHIALSCPQALVIFQNYLAFVINRRKKLRICDEFQLWEKERKKFY